MRKHCHFCRNNLIEIDYTDTDVIRRYLSPWAKIRPARDTGTCRKHQRHLADAIKRARFLALLPYTTR